MKHLFILISFLFVVNILFATNASITLRNSEVVNCEIVGKIDESLLILVNGEAFRISRNDILEIKIDRRLVTNMTFNENDWLEQDYNVIDFANMVLPEILDTKNKPKNERKYHGKRLYLDAGTSFNITRLNFDSEVSREGFDGKGVTYLKNYSIPNLNARLGLRVSEKFILVSDFQTIGFKEEFYYNWDFINKFFEEMKVEPINYFGGGFIFYPHPLFQLGVTAGEAIAPFITRNEKTNISDSDLFGLAYSLSLAYDIQIENIGILVGCNFFSTLTKATLKSIFPYIPTTNLYSIGLFIKIRY